MALLIAYFSLAILVSFLCSILEAVLLSITPSYIEAREQSGKKSGKYLKELKKSIDKPLAAILSLNTIAHTIGAAGVGAQASIVFEEVSIGVISGVLTFLILVFSEIIPKTLGANYWRLLAPASAVMLRFLIYLLYPFVLLSQLITKIIERKNRKSYSISRAEVSAIADIGHEEGVLEENESRILKNLVRLKSILVKDIMTPRSVVVSESEDMTVKEFYKKKDYLRFSRVPIFREKEDNITGYIHKHDILDQMAKDNFDMKLKELKRDILVIHEVASIPDLFSKFLEKQDQLAYVVDEFGSLSGIATMEDITETLLGIEIVDEYDSKEDMQIYAREKWKERARILGILPRAEERELKEDGNEDENENENENS